jgi:DNA-binding NarL/FixJ family response regulator
MSEVIRVVLADDHAVVRQGVGQFLEESGGIQVVAEASDGLEAVALIEEHRPDVAVVDIRMPGTSGIELTREIKERFSEIRVLVLTAFDDDPYVFALLEAGADGYVLKTASSDELVRAVRTVHQGQAALSPEIAGKLVRQATGQRSDQPHDPIEPLTARETDVLQLASRGMTNRAIGHELGISHRTVQGHLASVFGKLGVKSRTEAVTEALRRGWITIEKK